MRTPRIPSSSLIGLMIAGTLGLSAAQAQTNVPAAPLAPASTAAPAPIGEGQPGQAAPAAGSRSAHGEHGRHGHHGQHSHGEHRKATERFHEQRFNAMDADGDKHLSRAEFDAEHERMRARRMAAFDAADTDRDGRLSPTELKSFHRAMRKDMHESMRSAPR
ncbi:MAG: hypothetical protein RLZ51_2222 [Pseudomonadota bacterium]|jgi:hypothetical protein